MSGLILYTLSDSEFNGLRELVYKYTGISLNESKKELVKRRFSPRLKKLGLQSFQEYIDFVKKNGKSELSDFCNAITTNLTAFFRENHHYIHLAEKVIPELDNRPSHQKRLRIWSAGCSSGQEAYCLAITILENLSSPSGWDIKILATDLDENCIRTGREGIYPESEFEKTPKPIMDKYFTRLDNPPGRKGIYYQASNKLKGLISFKRLNFISEWPMKGKFDVIFCRNVFIYFNREMQRNLVDRFSTYQLPGSILYLGHSESIPTAQNSQYKFTGMTTYVRQ